jgi:hypothetical protein
MFIEKKRGSDFKGRFPSFSLLEKKRGSDFKGRFPSFSLLSARPVCGWKNPDHRLRERTFTAKISLKDVSGLFLDEL